MKVFKRKGLSFQFKLLTVAIPIVCIPALLISILFYKRYVRDVQAQASQYAKETAAQISYNMTSYLDELSRLVEAPYYSQDLMRVLELKPNNELAALEKSRAIEGFLAQIMITPRSDIISAFIVSDKIYHSGRYPASISNEQKPSSFLWYQKALQTNQSVFVSTHKEVMISTPVFEVFSVAKRINKMSNPSICLGVIKVDANFSSIRSLLDYISFGEQGGLFILDNEGLPVYQSNHNINLKELMISIKNSNTDIVTLAKQNYLYTVTPVKTAGWNIITMNSVSEITQSIEHTRIFILFVTLLCTVIALIILWVFLRSFLMPLKQIIRLMEQVQCGDLLVLFPEKRHDEIGELGAAFNAMLKKVNEMMLAISKAKQLQATAQINALYSQIHPHFLFNILNMVSLQIRCEKYDSAVDSIDELSALLRGMIKMKADIPLANELALLQNYLALQAKRYADRLTFTIKIPVELYDYRLPALLLQPIVENAVIHGCENSSEATHINISATAYENRTELCVTDNAGGIDEVNLKIITDRLSNNNIENASGGIGLINVNHRIKLRFGDEYGLNIKCKAGLCTKVTLCLPCSHNGELPQLADKEE